MLQANDFINELSAKMGGFSNKGEYEKSNEYLLENLPKLEKLSKKVKVKTLENFNEVMKLKSLLSGLFCYAFNNDNKIWEEVSRIEGVVGKKLFKFANGYKKIKDKKLKAISKYVITGWRRYYNGEDTQKIIEELINNNILYKHDKHYFIVGLHYAVGDNVFGIDRNGNQYRQYVKSCGLQAFWVNDRWYGILQHAKVDDKISELPDHYNKVSVADHKYSAKVYLTKEEKNIIAYEYRIK